MKKRVAKKSPCFWIAGAFPLTLLDRAFPFPADTSLLKGMQQMFK